MSASKVLEIARGEVGYLEKKSNSQLYNKTANVGNNNYTKYGAWFDNGKFQAQPWCDTFVSWCADQAGEASAVGHYAYVPSHQNFFEAKGRWHLKSGYTPVPGDVIIFRNESHIGFVEYVSGGYVHTIEGNTSGGSTLVANGGGVFKKSYPLNSSYILGYGHPAYGSDVVKKNYTIGWNEDNTGWWYANTTETYYAGKWAKINDKWYYFNNDGYILSDTWKKIDGKWYYFNESGHMLNNTWAKIESKWYCFDEEGYMMANTWKVDGDGTYYLGSDGAMMTNYIVGLNADGKLVPMERYYHTISELPSYYRTEVNKLITSGKFKGKSGEGDALVIDMPESAVRCMIIDNR